MEEVVRGLHTKNSGSHLPNKLEDNSIKLNVTNQHLVRSQDLIIHPVPSFTEITLSSNFSLQAKGPAAF